ncbi:MAG: NAD(P)-binding domain-containing protein [Deltaproteobacteria bacterium]|nr:NAD(P)-binding domain-containing protein [Deltaproteobacteria bacterium]
MNIAVILRSREMFTILKPFLAGHNVTHYTSKEDFLTGIKAGSGNLALIVNAGIPIGEDVLSFANIKLIQQFGIGYENVDIDYASKKGVLVFNVPTIGTYNAVSVAELSLFFMLALARDYNGCVNSISHGVANQPMGHSISGKKIAVVGLGGIGLELIKMLKPFKPEIYGFKHNKPQEGYAGKLGIKFAGTVDDDFKKVLPSADYIILAVPLEKNTENLIDDSAVGLMKSGAYIINVGRAGLINKSSLMKGLKSGKIKGAGLDVFWEEPVNISDEIFHFNVIATPHIGGATYESIADISRLCAENINGWINNGDLTNCVNKEKVSK